MSSGQDSDTSSIDTSSTAEQGTVSDSSDLQPHRFLGCYLLVSRSLEPRSKNRTYIGFTVDPTRRIKQHNGDAKHGGAKRTRRHRPWDMIAVVHGFANKTQALQFEWAWQNPLKSIALKLHLSRPDALPMPSMRVKSVNGCLQALAAMVSVPPWCLCPLTLTIVCPRENWDEFQIQSVVFPMHFRVNFSPLSSFSNCTVSYNFRHRCDATIPRRSHECDNICPVCTEPVAATGYSTRQSRPLQRLTHCSHCGVMVHLSCMASCRVPDENARTCSLLPSTVRCRNCDGQMHWSLVVRLARALSSDED